MKILPCLLVGMLACGSTPNPEEIRQIPINQVVSAVTPEGWKIDLGGGSENNPGAFDDQDPNCRNPNTRIGNAFILAFSGSAYASLPVADFLKLEVTASDPAGTGGFYFPLLIVDCDGNGYDPANDDVLYALSRDEPGLAVGTMPMTGIVDATKKFRSQFGRCGFPGYASPNPPQPLSILPPAARLVTAEPRSCGSLPRGQILPPLMLVMGGSAITNPLSIVIQSIAIQTRDAGRKEYVFRR